MRLALTGGSGFIGGRFVESALREGIAGRSPSILALTSSEESAGRVLSKHPAARAIPLPGLDHDSLIEAMRGCEALIHAAWSTVPAEAERDPLKDLHVNVESSIKLFQAAIAAGVRRIVFISSGGTVYGEPRWSPITEDHPLLPLSAYGTSKLCAEHYLLSLARAARIEALVLRPANVYGRDRSHDKPQGVVEHWLARLRAGQELISWNDTSVVRDYIHVDDVTAALIASLHRPVVEPFVNVGTGIGTSLSDLAELMQRVTGITVRLTASASHHPALSRNVLSTALMEKCLGIAPRVSLEEGIARTWASIAARGVKSDAAD